MNISARTRITFGLGFLLSSVLLAACAIDVVPDYRVSVRDGRGALCEAIAVNSSLAVARRDFKGLEAALHAVAERNPEILSAALRRADGRLLAEVGDHVTAWQPLADGISSDTQVVVPLRDGDHSWGAVEVRFRPIESGGWLGWVNSPQTRLVLFVTAAAVLVFSVYLGKVLEQLNPSKVVPGRVRNALNTLAEGLLVLDRNERIVLANQSFASLVGREPEKLVGVRASRLAWVREDEAAGTDALPWARALVEEKAQANVMMRLRTNDGNERSFVVNCSPVLGADGKYRGVLASFDDVTQLEAQKREISKSKEEADAANRAKSEFLARMSHEIRTPMNAILGFTDVLRRGFEGDEAERIDYLNTIHSSGQHLLTLINDILDLSKVEAGKLDVEFVRTSPVRLIADVVSVLRVRAAEKGIALESVVTGDVPETIETDPVRLRQMLMNLVGNAIKFTDSGGVRIVTRFVPSRRLPQLVIEVIDTGIGIPRESLAKVFEPFAQADTSITRRFGGTGLGLTICRRFADALGGELAVQSEVGVGSIFSVTLNTGSLEGVRLVDPRTQLTSSDEPSEEPAAEVRLCGARILVVDDGAENRKLLSLVLGRAGAVVETAVNGLLAIERAAAQSFDLILMDGEMPVMDGYTAARTLRDRGCTLPLIALTANAMKGDEEKCLAAGFSGYLTKPLQIDVLLATLALELGATAGESPPSAESSQRMPKPHAAPCPSVTPLLEHAAPAPRRELISTLPTDDAEFREIVEEFVGRLEQRLIEMELAHANRDCAELARLAHWLKGSGGTAGFDAFTAPARELERLAKLQQLDEIPNVIAELRSLVECIVVPESTLV